MSILSEKVVTSSDMGALLTQPVMQLSKTGLFVEELCAEMQTQHLGVVNIQ